MENGVSQLVIGTQMKLAVSINGKHEEIDFVDVSGSASLGIGGRRFKCEVSQPEKGFFLVVIEGRVYRCLIEQTPVGETEVIVNGERFAIGVHDLKHLRGSHGGDAGSDGPASLLAPMPGKVVRVLCAEGDEVTAGQGVLIVEAMKMQNEVQASRTGIVAKIRVNEGQTVNAGEVLAVIE
jgi:biotin carboxyl carrier protein